MKKIVHTLLAAAATILFCCPSLYAQTEPYSNNWYVGNTKAGEWLKFKKVWLSAGHYRFTTRSVAGAAGATVHLELNDQTLQANVPVPANSGGVFGLVHLGHKQLTEGYYDVKLVFETGNVNTDMIFIRKDESASDAVLENDTKYEMNFNQKMHTLAIGGTATVTKHLLKGGEQGDDVTWKSTRDNLSFTRKQVEAYLKPTIYTYDVDYSRNSADNYIQEMVEAKVQVIFAHGRGEPLANTKQIEDREFKTGPGGLPPAGLKYMVEAIRRNPYARDQIKVAYFVDNAPLTLSVQNNFNGDYQWGNPQHQQFIWDYAIKKWYQIVPRDMLYFTPDGKVPMQWWTANSHLDYGASSAHPPGTQILEFFQFIERKMKEEFELDVAFIMADNFFSRDSRTKDLAYGVQGWFTWRQLPLEIKLHDGKYFAFALNGGRLPMKDTALSTWDPETNTPTPITSDGKTDAHYSALKADGTELIRTVFTQGHNIKAEWIVLEAWSDWREGSTWHRSDHKEYAYPNQYISLVREYSDRTSGSIVLEVEGCDEYYNTTPGNLGGAYRLNLYKQSELDKEYIDANLEVDLDIFRPLHSLSALQGPIHTAADQPAKKIAAGWKDVWVIRESDNQIYCHEIDGYPVSTWRKLNNSQTVKDLTLGSNMAWMIHTNGNVFEANLPDQSTTNTASGWGNKNVSGITIIDVDAGMSTVWGVGSDRKVYYRNLSGSRPWTQVAGELTSIAADDAFVWGFAPNGDLMCMPAVSKSGWQKVENPYNVTKIAAGSNEVWGVTADNKIYRISSSGIGSWQHVIDGFKEVSIGVDYVWLLDTAGKAYKYDIYGYETASVFTDGATAVEPVRVADISVVVRPNPFADRLTVDISSYVAENAVAAVYDVNGKLLLSQNISLYQGTNTVEIAGVEKLSTGLYVLSVSSQAQTVKVKVLKR